MDMQNISTINEKSIAWSNGAGIMLKGHGNREDDPSIIMNVQATESGWII
jgi:hypothetical protein